MSRYSSQSGFSLVETLVSITILLIVITGPLAISSSAAKSSSFSSEQVTAFFLAQEGVELAEKARDDFFVKNASSTVPGYDATPWANFTRTSGAGLYKNCYINKFPLDSAVGCDFTIAGDKIGTLNLVNCNTLANCALYLDTTTNNLRSRYGHNSSNTTITPFTRVITFELINPNEVKVISRVTWRTGALRVQQEALVETRLFNAYGTP